MQSSPQILFTLEPEGGYTVNVPALPGCITYGVNIKEAKINAKEAIELYIESLRSHEKEVPNIT